MLPLPAKAPHRAQAVAALTRPAPTRDPEGTNLHLVRPQGICTQNFMHLWAPRALHLMHLWVPHDSIFMHLWVFRAHSSCLPIFPEVGDKIPPRRPFGRSPARAALPPGTISWALTAPSCTHTGCRHLTITRPAQRPDSLADLHGLLVIVPEEVIGLVGLHRFPAVHP